jgi:hypothetical protein
MRTVNYEYRSGILQDGRVRWSPLRRYDILSAAQDAIAEADHYHGTPVVEWYDPVTPEAALGNLVGDAVQRLAGPALSWEELDQLESAGAVAEALRLHKVVGLPRSTSRCPLAAATGWEVTYHERIRWIPALTDDETDDLPLPESSVDIRRPLTPAEAEFVAQFDRGVYPELLDREAEAWRLNLSTGRTDA